METKRAGKIKWFKSLPLITRFDRTIEANHLLDGDTVDNHPNKLTESQIVKIYDYNFDNTSIVRSNMLMNKYYRPYCGECVGLQRLSIVTDKGQHQCPKCGYTTKYSIAFINLFNLTHNGD